MVSLGFSSGVKGSNRISHYKMGISRCDKTKENTSDGRKKKDNR